MTGLLDSKEYLKKSKKFVITKLSEIAYKKDVNRLNYVVKQKTICCR